MIAGSTVLETALGHSLSIGLFKVLGSNANACLLLPKSLTSSTQAKGEFAQINHCLVSGSFICIYSRPELLVTVTFISWKDYGSAS